MTKNNVIAIIQARVGSTRLPKKVLLDIVGKPMLWHVIERVKKCRTINQIVVATTDKKEDEAMVELAKKCGVKTFIGSENDVLDRYYQAAKKFRADIIARVTGDCPLTDPELVDELVGYFIENQNSLDFVNRPPEYEGLDGEVFSFRALEGAWKEAKKPSEREHVMPYIFNHPEIFHLSRLESAQYGSLPHNHWSVDEESDLEFVRKIYENLYKEDEIFYTEDILKLLKKNPKLMEINKGLTGFEGYYKSLENDKKINEIN